MNIAFLLKGSVSKTSGRSNMPGIANNPDSYVNYNSTFSSIKRHIVNVNPNHNFDFYIHTWHPDLHRSLTELYNPKAILTESNDLYKDEIISKLTSSECNISNFGNTSQCLSIKNGFDLIRNSNIHYDLVVFYRLDILLWKDMILDDSYIDNITINNFMEGHGDFHFIMNYDNADQFSKIYDNLSPQLQPIPHLCFRDYIMKHMCVPFKMDNIVAGKDQEVTRKLKLLLGDGRITPDILSQYGLTAEEINKYEIGIF